MCSRMGGLFVDREGATLLQEIDGEPGYSLVQCR